MPADGKLSELSVLSLLSFDSTVSCAPKGASGWSKSIAGIDEQLFEEYGLDEAKRNFIRTKVKEMT